MTANGAVPLDPEIDAMHSIAQALEGLGDEARARVLRWGADRYGVTISSRGDARVNSDDLAEDGIEVVDAGGDDVEEYEHFAELYDAANPKTDAQKLLVAAYWSHLKGQATFGSQALNTLLKDLGHGVTHISERMEQLIKSKPSLVLQLRKAGKTAQARKTYKITTAGTRAVESMISGDA